MKVLNLHTPRDVNIQFIRKKKKHFLTMMEFNLFYFGSQETETDAGRGAAEQETADCTGIS